MAKSSRSTSRKSSGTVTVIEARVHRSARRNARIAFTLAFLGVGAFTLLVASSMMQPVLSLLLALLAGLVAGAVAWAAVRVWTFVRIIWWWLPELVVAAVVVELWSLLSDHTPLVVRVAVVALLVGALTFPRVRRFVVSFGWCLIVRHRLRVCFSQFIVSNQSGSLPLIFIARPTPVGERVWIYLRPGLSVSDLETRLERIAVACHASHALVERASARTAAFVRVDIKRREVLGHTVGSPLSEDVADTAVPVSPAPAGVMSPLSVRPEMDLADEFTKPSPPAQSPVRPLTSPVTSGSAKKVAAVVASGTDEDLSDWID